MSEPAVIVCERGARWTSAIARVLPRGTPLVQTRGLAECDRQLMAQPGCLVVLEVGYDPLARSLHWLAELNRRDALATAVVVASPDWQAFEWPLREAGAIGFVSSPRALGSVAQAWDCQLKRAERPKGPLAAQIWNALPWREASTAGQS